MSHCACAWIIVAYPMPRVDDMIDALGKAKFVTTLDLARGYWQVPVPEESRPLTAFPVPRDALWSAATFQRMMDRVLADCSGYAAAYLDDVIIHSTCWEDHVRHVPNVLQKLRRAGLTQFGMNSCSYLGHVVGNGEVQPEKAKLQAVEKFPTPTTKKQVRDSRDTTVSLSPTLLRWQPH